MKSRTSKSINALCPSPTKWVWIIAGCLLAALAMPICMAAQDATAQKLYGSQAGAASARIQSDCSGRPGLPLRLPKLPPRFANSLCRSLEGAKAARPSRDVPANDSYGTFITIDAPGDVYGTTVLQGINPRGDIVGGYVDSNNIWQTFVLSGGTFRNITPHDAVAGGFAGLIFATQMGINPQGDIVSVYVNGTRDYTTLGFLLSKGQYTPIDPPGVNDACAGGTMPAGINPRGDIVGSYPSGPDCFGHGFLLSHGVYTNVDVPGAIGTTPAAINPKGDILGEYYESDAQHGFLLSKGTFTTIDVPGSIFDFFFGMNPQGDMVGAECCVTPTAGFLLSHGTLTAVDAPGSVLTFPYGIDPQGNIVGQYYDADFKSHGFVLVKR
jgi:hypothetical protein